MKKNERISIITKKLSDHPSVVFRYSYFCELFGIGKASVCEDVAVVKEAFESMGDGISKPTPALPACRLVPCNQGEEERAILFEIQKQLLAPERRIQGGLYLLQRYPFSSGIRS